MSSTDAVEAVADMSPPIPNVTYSPLPSPPEIDSSIFPTEEDSNKGSKRTADSHVDSHPGSISPTQQPPPRLRPKMRAPILRVRTGCFTCRARKKKCDEIKPVCTGCERNRLRCQWPLGTETRRYGRRRGNSSSSSSSNATTNLVCGDNDKRACEDGTSEADSSDANMGAIPSTMATREDPKASDRERLSSADPTSTGVELGSPILTPAHQPEASSIPHDSQSKAWDRPPSAAAAPARSNASTYHPQTTFAPPDINSAIRFGGDMAPAPYSACPEINAFHQVPVPQTDNNSFFLLGAIDDTLLEQLFANNENETSTALPPPDIETVADGVPKAATVTDESIPAAEGCSLQQLDTSTNEDGSMADMQEAEVPRPESTELARTPSLLPNYDARAMELLSYYIGRTATSMGNGAKEENPFVSQLIPLSFANPFILDLILCQSAAHRGTVGGDDGPWVNFNGEANQKLQLAHAYYNRSLGLFRKSINHYVQGRETNPLWISIGALIMCFTETAKGDTHGVVFDHINAAGPLLGNLITQGERILSNDLKDFVTEYYVYTATLSMISIDPTNDPKPALAPAIEDHANYLVATGYVGQLSGCWLQLLLLIPRIFDFGQRVIALSREQSGSSSSSSSMPTMCPSPADFLTFSDLQSRILGHIPSAKSQDVMLCGNIIKQAMHVYLLSALDSSRVIDLSLRGAIQGSLNQALSYLAQLPPDARINTSLCWALAVLGQFMESEEQRDMLRERLDVMFLTIGLGNIRATSKLLESMWSLPREERGPWSIAKAMRQCNTWISFA